MAKLENYQDRVVIVTGASSGIGRELARQLAARGATVALVARRTDRLDEEVSAIRSAGGKASAHPCDVCDRTAVNRVCQAVLKLYGRIDVLVNNAGYGRHVLFKDHEVEDIERMMQTNYMGVVYWMKAVLQPMRDRGEGFILNFSSFAGVVSQPDESAYCATKFAFAGLSESVSYELRPLNIQVSTAYPVLVKTELFTNEVMARMPKESLNGFMDVGDFVKQTLHEFEKGQINILIPKRYAWVQKLKALFPTMMGNKISAVKLEGLPDVTS